MMPGYQSKHLAVYNNLCLFVLKHFIYFITAYLQFLCLQK